MKKGTYSKSFIRSQCGLMGLQIVSHPGCRVARLGDHQTLTPVAPSTPCWDLATGGSLWRVE